MVLRRSVVPSSLQQKSYEFNAAKCEIHYEEVSKLKESVTSLQKVISVLKKIYLV